MSADEPRRAEKPDWWPPSTELTGININSARSVADEPEVERFVQPLFLSRLSWRTRCGDLYLLPVF